MYVSKIWGREVVLQVCLSKQKNVDAILNGLEKTVYLVYRCTGYEVLYTAEARMLRKTLKFLAEVIRMLNGDRRKFFLSTSANSSSGNHLKAAVTEGISNHLYEIEQLEKTVGRDASVAEAHCIIHPYRESTGTRC